MSAIDDDNSLYESLLPAYRALDPNLKSEVLESFSLLRRTKKINGNGTLPKGEALRRAMIGHGVLIEPPTVMDEDEYENILKAQEAYDAL